MTYLGLFSRRSGLFSRRSALVPLSFALPALARSRCSARRSASVLLSALFYHSGLALVNGACWKKGKSAVRKSISLKFVHSLIHRVYRSQIYEYSFKLVLKKIQHTSRYIYIYIVAPS